MDCFAIARNDAKRYAQGKSVILRALARRISCKKRSFTFVQDDALSHSGISPTRHCETRSVEAIQERDTSGSALSMTGKRQKVAFTLAEVLITLGIIGVVAAMTLPTLIANYQKKVVETRLISFYSKINQAYRMSYAENGDTVDWITSDKNYSYDEMVKWLEQYIFPYMKHYNVKQCNVETTGQIGVCVTIPDGSLYWFSIDRNGQDVAYYVNGNTDDSGPRNMFQFNFSKRVKNDGSTNKQSMDFIDPYVFDWDGRRESLFTNGTWGCRKGCTNCAYCTKLIQLNGWEIPDDYPW